MPADILLDAVSPLERLKLTTELSSVMKAIEANPAPVERLKLSVRLSELLALLGADEGQQEDELSDDPNSPNYRYRDTGYIPNSRKELAQSMIFTAKKNGQRVIMNDIDWDAIEQNPRQAAELITKSNLFGKTDWTALEGSGMDPAAGFLIDKIYASIGPEPTSALPTDTMKMLADGSRETLSSLDQLDRTSADALAQTRKDYARGLETIRDRLENKKTVDEVMSVIADIRGELMGAQLNASQADEVAALEEKAAAIRGEYQELREESDKLFNALRALESQYDTALREKQKRDSRKWKPDPELEQRLETLKAQTDAARELYIDFRDSRPDAFKTEKREHPSGGYSYDSDIEYAWRQLRYQISAITRAAKMFNLMTNPTTRAWLTFGERFFKLINYRSYRGSDTFAGHVTNAKAGKIKDWSWANKERPTKPKAATQNEINFQLKVVDSYQRRGGRDISVKSTTELKEMLGFRDVQSGNWVLKDPNSAKFHVEQTAAAMSDMADILGIDMKLLGYGGRLGMAFGARGSGGKGAARAHYEPVHRVINLTKMGGGGALGHEWFHSLDNIIHEMATATATGTANQYTSELPDLLPEGPLREAMRGVHNALMTGDVPSPERHLYTASDIKTAKLNLDNPRYELPKAIKAAGNRTDAIRTVDEYFGRYRSDKRRLKQWRTIAVAYYHKGELPEENVKVAVTLATGPKVSSFAAEAMRLDTGSEGKYWSKPREMAARAFQAYLEDKLAAADRQNDYLSAMADNKYYVDPIFGFEDKPFPEGDERKRLNDAFDKLFEVLRSEKVFEKAVSNDALMDAIFGIDHYTPDVAFESDADAEYCIFDAVSPSERLKLSMELNKLVEDVNGADPVTRLKLAQRINSIIVQLSNEESEAASSPDAVELPSGAVIGTYTLKAKKIGRKWIAATSPNGSFEVQVYLGGSTKSWVAGETYTFKGAKHEDRNRYGVKVTYWPEDVIPAEAKQAAADVGLEKLFARIESTYKSGYIKDEDVTALKKADTEGKYTERVKDLRDSLAKRKIASVVVQWKAYLRESVESKVRWYDKAATVLREKAAELRKLSASAEADLIDEFIADMKKSLAERESKIKEAKARAAEELAAQGILHRMFYADRSGRGLPMVGQVMKVGEDYKAVSEVSKGMYLGEDASSFGGSDDKPYQHRVTLRPATEAEIATLVEEDRALKEQAEARAWITKLGRNIMANGTRPESAEVSGETVVDTFNIYGGGERFVIGPDRIWYIRNNGMDGDDWSQNNVRTGGAGAIGFSIPYDEEVADTLRRYARLLV